jgi:hypothetical protein
VVQLDCHALPDQYRIEPVTTVGVNPAGVVKPECDWYQELVPQAW